LFRKTPAARLEWSEGLVQSCALRQSAILEQAARMVRPGGYLAYSTCTFAPQENEAVIERFLRQSQQREEYRFEIAAIEHVLGLDPGRPEWVAVAEDTVAEDAVAEDAVVGARAEEAKAGAGTRGRRQAGAADAAPIAPSLAQARRIWPHHSPGEGHFIALLQRTDDGDPRQASRQPPRPKRGKPDPDQAHAVGLFTTFVQETFQELPLDGELILSGGYLYAQPLALPPLRGVKVIHPGLWLGTVKKDRFEPSHALALAVRSDQARRILVLEPGSAACAAYLRGETLPAEGMVGEGAGWCLVSVAAGEHSFPLGWGKRTGEMVKNAYPKGLRAPS
jgi:NOL1/NOP2/fmu family ribosome biogenesis protein